ncbi:hypothetical protein A4G19_09025 [Pasteurellaceae bacterium Macca]|nr:hypothetical protein [Pasteurellaceae bacterium Macca]
MKKISLLFIATLVLSPATFAKERVLFSCTSKSGKQLTITEDSYKYYYSYGKNGRPEMAFSNLKENQGDVQYGSSFTFLELENKGVTYFINSQFRGGSSAGVEVSKNGKKLAYVGCVNIIKDFD